MKNCLVTKLKADTGNNSLLRVGEMFIDVIKQDNPTNQTNRLYLKNELEDIVLEVEDGSANLTTDENMSTGWVSKMTLPKNPTTYKVFVRNGDYRIKVRSKYTMSKIGDYTSNIKQTAISVNTKSFRFNETLTYLIVGKISGNVDGLSKTKLERLNGDCSNLTGNIASLEPLTSLTSISLGNNPHITGDIASFAHMTSLTSISLGNNTNVTGNIASLEPLTSLTSISFAYCPNITGDIKNIRFPLSYLNAYGSSITGELIEFVKTQRAQGRTTGECSTSWWGDKITFNGAVPSASDRNLTWTETSITLGSTTVNQ